MPLRDHFRPPVDNVASWEELRGGWPMVIVQQLNQTLPPAMCELTQILDLFLATKVP